MIRMQTAEYNRYEGLEVVVENKIVQFSFMLTHQLFELALHCLIENTVRFGCLGS